MLAVKELSWMDSLNRNMFGVKRPHTKMCRYSEMGWYLSDAALVGEDFREQA